MQKNLALVSVIMPVYCVEKYLRQSIDSICKQTYEKLEIILIDDGSPDSCGYICDEYASKDLRIKVIHKENGGLSSARNIGLDTATGEYVVFVDTDDTVHPEFIESLFGLCKLYDCDIAQCDFLAVKENSLELPLNPQQTILIKSNRQAIHELCGGKESVKYTVVWNKIYKRELFDNIRFPIGKIHEDEFTTYLVLWKAKKIVVTNQYLYYYLQRTDSITRERFNIRQLDVLEAFKGRVKFLEENKLYSDYYITLTKLINLIEKYYILVKDNISNCRNICCELLKEEEDFKKKLSMSITEEKNLQYQEMVKRHSFTKETRIVLYGAGKWGYRYYQLINDNQCGKIVGWVDNSWYSIEYEIPVTPLDSLLKITYDFIIIAIESETVQEEVFNNLISWGIEQEKILLI